MYPDLDGVLARIRALRTPSCSTPSAWRARPVRPRHHMVMVGAASHLLPISWRHRALREHDVRVEG